MPELLKTIETPDPLNTAFAELGIAAVTYSHPAVFTVEEGRDFKHLMPGGHTKNLFLKDKKGKIWLVTALWDTVIDLKKLPARLDAGRLSFGNSALLMDVLGVIPGAVTALALVNDRQRLVTPVLDQALMKHDVINCHPLENDKTTGLAPQDLVKFMESMGYRPLLVDFSRI